MLSKHAIGDIASKIASKDFTSRCERMDLILHDSLLKAFENERISQERMQRIINKFTELVSEVKFES